MGLLTILLVTGAPLSSCLRKSKSSVQSSEAPPPPAIGLDINDVSILLPMPEDPADASKMLKMGFTNDEGKAPMTPELFLAILERHDTTQDIEGKTMPLKSGAGFTGTKRIVQALQSFHGQPQVNPRTKPTNFGPYDRLDDWKIVALRFDPCAPSLTNHDLPKASIEELSRFDPEKCMIQLRLTAQPVLNSRESGFGAEDYAIHMLFKLDFKEGQELYQDLVTFKQECSDVSSSLPLMRQPCLKLESEKVGYGGPHLLKIEGIIKRYARNFVSLAMMATGDGDDPWVFMNGLILQGKFVHLPIGAVHKDDPATLRRGQNGNLLEPFLNGYFQQIDFLSLGGDPRAKSIRVSPVPVASKVKDFLLEEYNGITGDVSAVRPKINAIENPLDNNFFTTDCASCHATLHAYNRYAATKVFQHSAREFSSQEANALARKGLLRLSLSSPEETYRQDLAFLQKTDSPHAFSISGPYLAMPEPSSRRSLENNSVGDHPKRLLHFAYHFRSPIISQRTANESALAAKRANLFFGKGIEPPALCPRESMEQCLADPRQLETTITAFETISYCLLTLCPERAKALEPLFGERVVKKYRLKQALTYRNPYQNTEIEAQLLPTLAAGTEIYGQWKQKDDATGKYFAFIPYKALEFSSSTYPKLFGQPLQEVKLLKDNVNWQDAVELIDAE